MTTEKPVYISTKDYLVSGEQFNLLHDTTFDMLITQPKPANEELAKYYESDAYISHTDDTKGLLSFLYQRVKKYSLRKKVSLLSLHQKQKGTLLDIGAGTGDFLVAAQHAGWSVHGVEVNKTARNKAADKNIQLQETIAAFEGKKFEAITLWHVLEHIPNLDETILALEQLLDPQGILIIAVPNFKSYDALYYKNHWAAYDTPRHLWHFSRAAIPKLFGATFKLIETRPMIFDAFYVSLLSEKYKSGNKFSIKALRIGFISNLKAIKSKEHSSVIYCLKKTK